jgi:nicotinamidase-related amidase
MKNNIAVYETDVQHDFTGRNGALFVQGFDRWSNEAYGAEAMLPNIFAIHKKAADEGWRIIGSVDRHFYEDAELKRNEGGVFVDHCMNGTIGQLRERELEPQKDVYIRAKDGPLMGIRAYTEAEMQRFVDSGAHLIFEKQTYDVDTNRNFAKAIELLFNRGVNKVVFNGFATDYCVRAAVLATAKYRDQLEHNVQLYVVNDAIKEVGIDFQGEVSHEFVNQALEDMAKAGAKFVTTKDVLENRI